MLPEGALEYYFAWQMAGKDTVKFFEILRTCTILDLYTAYAMKRVDLFIEYIPK